MVKELFAMNSPITSDANLNATSRGKLSIIWNEFFDPTITRIHFFGFCFAFSV